MKNLLIFVFPVTTIVSLLIIGGCLFVNEKHMTFTHKEHTANGISCKACHINALKKDKAGMPDGKNCVYCHETVYNDTPVGDIYNFDKWKALKEERTSLFDEVIFSHKTHKEKGVNCVKCHGDIAESVSVIPDHIPDANTCVQCHSKWLNQFQCDKCHKKTRMTIPPEDHKRSDFMSVHGKNLKNKPFDNWQEITGRHSKQCFQCHKQDYCIKCHQAVEPQNHTNQWRLIGHGISAGIKRDSCKACHRTDFCFRCHESKRPRSHVANWGATRSRHCSYCHEPLSSNSCFVCHKETPSHDNAPNAPLFVRKDWPCRVCHPVIVPLDHFDNGDDCENCHKTTRPSAKTSRRLDRLLDRLGR